MNQPPIASSTSSFSKGVHNLSKSEVSLTPPFPDGPAAANPPLSYGAGSSFELRDRLSLNQLTSLRWSLVDDLQAYGNAGLSALGVSWRKLSEYGVQRGVRHIQQTGMSVSSLGWIGGFTGENGYSLRESIQEGKRMIRVAGQLRASTVTVVSGPLGGHIRSHATRLVCDGLLELAELAAIYGVELAFQPMHPIFEKNWSFINSLDESLQLLDRISSPSIKLAFGTYHLCNEDGILNRIPEIADRVSLVSLSDMKHHPRCENDRLLPGDGELPLADVIHAFETHGYDGWYEVEVWSQDLWKLDHDELLRRCLESGRQLSSQLEHCRHTPRKSSS